MKNFALVLIILLGVAWACTPDEEIIVSGSIEPLVFSTDTVFFDTLLTEVGSITKRLIVTNPNRNAVNISSIRLGELDASPYTIHVNGIRQQSFEDEVILGNDSILILVEVFIDPKNEDLPFLVKDSLTFQTNALFQDVKLVSYGQEANFLSDSILNCDIIWDSPKPYVISNSVLIDTLCSLTIRKGVRIFSDIGSRFLVAGQLIVEGESEEPVLFSGTRLDPDFENAAGQWDGLIFLPTSHDNTLSNTSIRNAINGIQLFIEDNNDNPDLILENTIIENMSQNGLLSFESDISGANLLINNCAEQLMGCAGGFVELVHCTLTNFASDFIRSNDVPSTIFVDTYEVDETTIFTTIHLNLINSIVWSNSDEDLIIGSSDGSASTFFIANSILNTSANNLNVNENLLNVSPLFSAPFERDFSLESSSPAIDNGLTTNVLNDLIGNPRDDSPDLGAFEYFPEEE